MKWRQILAAVMALSMATTTVGCGQTGAKPSGKITLTLWYWNDSIDDNLLKQVDKAFPNVHLQAEKIGGNFESKLIAAMYADDAPDITAINSADFIATMVKDYNQFVNLNQFPEVRQAKKLYLGWKWNLASTPDHKYQVAIPMDTGPVVLYYNTKVFKKAGLPTSPEAVSKKLKTWQNYIQAGEQIKAKTGVPLVDNLTTVYNAALNQGKKYYFTSDMKPIYEHNPVVQNAWNLAVEFHQKGLSADIDEWTTAWSAAAHHDGFASFIGASWMVPQLQQSDSRQGVWRVAAAPGGAADLGGSFIGVTKDCKYPELAAKIILWLQNPEHQAYAYHTLGLYPSTPSAFTKPIMNQPSPYFGGENINQYFAASDKAIDIGFQSPYDSTVNNYFTQELALVAHNNKNPNAAWADAIAEINDQMRRILVN
ncbi:MAG: ABC transporter substrate-binding protein [Alicyclobacillus herbarius]|uniref:ABC transporter substrate-binding protein n=1 Tax=Alicyclobacillus herbarius TaxID=122960 RepID=UPI002357FD15|nr:ABC transporter substrate-binding protein [Alicyclobacillus herbarius]MCL6631837.1 ABC transporter substrate-binding protein [Alicyclobacillus herbarius]